MCPLVLLGLFEATSYASLHLQWLLIALLDILEPCRQLLALKHIEHAGQISPEAAQGIEREVIGS